MSESAIIELVGEKERYKRCKKCKSKLEKVLDKPGQYICSKCGQHHYSAIESLTSTRINNRA